MFSNQPAQAIPYEIEALAGSIRPLAKELTEELGFENAEAYMIDLARSILETSTNYTRTIGYVDDTEDENQGRLVREVMGKIIDQKMKAGQTERNGARSRRFATPME